MPHEISIEEPCDDYPRIEEGIQHRLDETLESRGPQRLWDLFARLEPVAGDALVDVGCGEGGDAIELSGRFGITVTSVDPVT